MSLYGYQWSSARAEMLNHFFWRDDLPKPATGSISSSVKFRCRIPESFEQVTNPNESWFIRHISLVEMKWLEQDVFRLAFCSTHLLQNLNRYGIFLSKSSSGTSFNGGTPELTWWLVHSSLLGGRVSIGHISLVRMWWQGKMYDNLNGLPWPMSWWLADGIVVLGYSNSVTLCCLILSCSCFMPSFSRFTKLHLFDLWKGYTQWHPLQPKGEPNGLNKSGRIFLIKWLEPIVQHPGVCL